MTETLVGWDGSPEADLALDWAVERAEHEHDGIVLVGIEDATAPIPGQVVTEQMVSNRLVAVDAAAERLSEQHPRLRIRTEVVEGDRLRELQRRSQPDNLIVLGTGRRHGLSLRYGWSLGARLAAIAHGAVAVIPELTGEERSGVVVGVDGSEVALKAARFAAREARRLGQELIVVHAWLEPMVNVPDVRMEGPFLGELEEEHRIVIESAVHSLSSSNPDLTVTPVLVRDEANHALKAAVPSASMLVLGTMQPRGVERMLLGSTSHTMLLDIAVPTVVVTPDYIL